MKIAIAGAGYVGLSIAVLLAQKNEVVIFDIDEEKINKLNNNTSPFADDYIEDYLAKTDLNINASSDQKEVYKNADYIIIATPTD